LAPVLCAAELAGASGRDFLAALAVAYQVQCRLADAAPVRDRGFDHTTHGAYAVAAGAARALGLDARAAAHAIALAGAAGRGLRAEEVQRIEIDIFDVAHRIIGGGEEGGKHAVRTKEEADHSLPYMAAAALLDGELGPAQYEPARIARADVQALLRRIEVLPD